MPGKLLGCFEKEGLEALQNTVSWALPGQYQMVPSGEAQDSGFSCTRNCCKKAQSICDLPSFSSRERGQSSGAHNEGTSQTETMDPECISQSTCCAGSVGDCSACQSRGPAKPPGKGCCTPSSYKEVLPGPGGYDCTFASSSPVKAMPLAQE